ncbi:periplasmic carboxy-terminal processing protease [Citrifermentans bemidjiense Bem]|uniref:Periplasmic carboxy-terminal processing protease n=1 Tax=Citrifermentans bemidjiense (strain ATCC BAA-1014 / DSM 16622 / JCM 12645 / Bem) TaxID=404380 RepID=B5E9C2_CITBB|nr:S41 family peptidase [Citrifermentans bemidjiense]ACH38664.1 periplasmic carboxy-terminal processing protease [Citrifermentans bemidjiense Bem]
MSKKVFAAFAVIFLLLSLVLMLPLMDREERAKRSEAEYLEMFRDVVNIVKQSYVDKVDDKKLMAVAINGMLATLDPHSNYLPATDYTEMKVHMAGAFGGLGIELEMRNGKLMVNAPIEDTPAFRAGIQSGDHIWTIDGKPTADLNINQCVSRMRGTPGTSVTLGILREGKSSPLTFRLVRAIIKTKSLKGRLLEPGYGYIRIGEFQERTGEDFEKALKTLAADNGQPLSGLVLDLRFNPGGLVDQACRVANRFIGEGLSSGVIVTTKGREAAMDRSLTATVGDKEPRYPIVVLINGGSASASEIVAGALQDHKRAVIMGTQSFGKGSVQSVMTLDNGDGLKLTTARYYTPSGRSIQAKGITPDIVVEFAKPAPAKDKQKDAKELEIREQDLDGHMDQAPAPPRPASPAKPHSAPPAKPQQKPSSKELKEQDLLKADNQLARALDLLKGVNLLKASGRR